MTLSVPVPRRPMRRACRRCVSVLNAPASVCGPKAGENKKTPQRHHDDTELQSHTLFLFLIGIENKANPAIRRGFCHHIPGNSCLRDCSGNISFTSFHGLSASSNSPGGNKGVPGGKERSEKSRGEFSGRTRRADRMGRSFERGTAYLCQREGGGCRGYLSAFPGVRVCRVAGFPVESHLRQYASGTCSD